MGTENLNELTLSENPCNDEKKSQNEHRTHRHHSSHHTHSHRRHHTDSSNYKSDRSGMDSNSQKSKSRKRNSNGFVDQKSYYKKKKTVKRTHSEMNREKKLILKMVAFMIVAIPVLLIILNFLDKFLRELAE